MLCSEVDLQVVRLRLEFEVEIVGPTERETGGATWF